MHKDNSRIGADLVLRNNTKIKQHSWSLLLFKCLQTQNMEIHSLDCLWVMSNRQDFTLPSRKKFSLTCSLQKPTSLRPQLEMHSVCSLLICFIPLFPWENWIGSSSAPWIVNKMHMQCIYSHTLYKCVSSTRNHYILMFGSFSTCKIKC